MIRTDPSLDVTFMLDAYHIQGPPEQYVDMEHIRILVAGSRDEVFRIATDEDRRRFPAEYKAFKDGVAEVGQGFALSAWPGATPALLKELALQNIRTVEQLADLPDHFATGPGMIAKRSEARAWVAASSGNEAEIAGIAAENEALKLRMEAQASELAALRQMLEMATETKQEPVDSAGTDA